MNQLEKTITSLDVAEMVGRRHDQVLRDIETIIKHLGDDHKSVGNYFIQDEYKDSLNRVKPCYKLTKKGCELYSTRMTGEKGTQFAVEYIERFNKMENHIKQEIDTTQLSPELQMFQGLFNSIAKQELATKNLNTKVDGIRDVVALNTVDWRKDSRQLINKIAQCRGGFGAYKEVNNEIYKEVERRGGFMLNTRLTNKRRRMADEGANKSKRDKLTKVDVIADDKRLIEIYVAIVKEFAIKYDIENGGN